MIYRLGNIEIDPANFLLTENGETVSVEPLVFDLIVYLIENRDRFQQASEVRVVPCLDATRRQSLLHDVINVTVANSRNAAVSRQAFGAAEKPFDKCLFGCGDRSLGLHVHNKTFFNPPFSGRVLNDI